MADESLVRINVLIKKSTLDKFKEVAADQGHTMSFLIKRWINKYLERMASAEATKEEHNDDDTSEV